MIKKLQSYPIIRSDGAICGAKSPDNYTITDKVNEIIDELNHILEERESGIKVYEEVKRNMEIENQQVIIYGAYAKNRHLIGKLCKFKFGAGYSYGILTNIKRKPCRWAFESNGRAFSSCEPIKPDDDIIYKGE